MPIFHTQFLADSAAFRVIDRVCRLFSSDAGSSNGGGVLQDASRPISREIMARVSGGNPASVWATALKATKANSVHSPSV